MSDSSAAGSRVAASTASAFVRPARRDDVPAILGLVRDLATYEREPDAVLATEDLVGQALFGAEPRAFAHVVEHTGEDGATSVAGFALWFLNFSTWLGRHGIWLEDLYVRPEHRGRGYGQLLLRELAGICVERGYGRLEWWVLDWNVSAHGFYRRIGAAPQDEWTVWRLTGDALESLGTSIPGQPPQSTP